MTLEGCFLFNPYLYLASRKCRDLANVASGRVGAGVASGMNRLGVTASGSNSVPHAFDCSSNLSQNWKHLDNGRSQGSEGSKTGLFGI